MAITFLEKRKRLKSLIPILVGIILITAVIIWRGFFAKKPTTVPPEIIPKMFQEVQINFQTLENPVMEEFQIFEKTPPLEGEIGRENPFIPYFK
ncbi:MAG: hypothetical protein AUJ31_00785 [Parcubacteria group bacterium CG1_02_39_15]|uniref:Uncharacterized protein n=3 Tax=Candidatus Nealsoniibacteriota TaxID=1817911 RepID=A0A2H0MNL3_9BACT|nr:MAG: hypothetical protein AUJ31_00785 [Parcubacteria group bacterium CG1_02_39_15]PIQ98258.1 MAG: hypothetical protein COV64_02330 [Candidatus Nealsonbacteria bacterium CG11_big_fil_rev_8_21_14_0_20_39_9]PIW90296.1 MAG: hypothetical protein COZ92_01155 [Candidatus Nealsonbacteria bacterium CG_4_8_14_3_um_filter_40_11]PIZ88172.1 MAG: hypothetical protein COX91_01575 [Candidatus Nealsonbacteria bacterium CG_4_10_14_0_2_um_filter_39_15]